MFLRRDYSIIKLKQISQEELASLAGLHRTYISSIEHSDRNLSIDNIEKIAQALDVRVADLVSDSSESPKDATRWSVGASVLAARMNNSVVQDGYSCVEEHLQISASRKKSKKAADKAALLSEENREIKDLLALAMGRIFELEKNIYLRSPMR